MKIEIVDNFLSDYYADTYVKVFDGIRGGAGCFPWYFKNVISGCLFSNLL